MKVFLIVVILFIGWGKQTCAYSADSNSSSESVEKRNKYFGGNFQGDLIVTDEQRKELLANTNTRRTVRNVQMNSLWPSSEILYSLDDRFSDEEKTIITKALEEISSVTCLTFPLVTNLYDKRDRIHVSPEEEGCFADFGYTQITHRVNIGVGCLDSRTIKHEFLHSLGMHHQHNVPNRDDYIKIVYDNVDKENIKSFDKVNGITTSFNLPYDFLSIMHYYDESFAKKPGLKTILALPKYKKYQDKMGTLKTLSEIDIIKLKTMYCK